MEYWSSWISPGAAFFLFVNLLIGAIVVTSRGQQGGGRAASRTRRLCRSASSMVLDRLRSFTFFSVHSSPLEECYHTSLELQAEEQQPEAAVAEPATTAPPASAPAAAAADEASQSAKEDKAGVPSLQGDAEQSPSASGDVVTAAVAVERQEEKVTPVAATTMPRARACRREPEEALEGKARLNARAELFIRQFREDLKLQRLNSIVNYTRALRRGAAGAPPAPQ